VLAVDERGIRLDRTVFYPLGGGQAGDSGRLTTASGQVITIADTRKGAGPGEIVHVPAPGADLGTLAPGDTVTAEIDWARRHRHMRFHTATHLLCALVPHPVDGCSITADYARLDFHMTEPLDKEALTAGIARLVAEARAVGHRWITEDELDANPGLVRSMSVQPPRGLGRVRVMEVEGVDLQPCGGTHVANTAEIGAVVVTKVEKKSAKTRRVVLGFAEPAPQADPAG
jgi:misacylated tRNA(Ala) deacylase